MAEPETNDNVQKLHNLLLEIGKVERIRFPAGWGFLIDSFQFALLVKDTVYLCVDETLKKELLAEGSEPFYYLNRGRKTVVDRFYSLPEKIMKDPRQFRDLAFRALTFARANQTNSNPVSDAAPSPHAKKILLVCTSHSQLGNTGNKTGVWFDQVASAYNVIAAAGFNIEISSPAGGKPPADPGSNSPEYRTNDIIQFEQNAKAMSLYENSTALSSIDDCSLYDAVFLIGGHGTMWDFPDNPELEWILTSMYTERKPICAVCHGVAGLLNVNPTTEKSFLHGKKVTGFSNEEEALIGLTRIVPFLLEDRIRETGGKYSQGPAMFNHVVVDGLLVTGQNPFSTHATAQSLIELMAPQKAMTA